MCNLNTNATTHTSDPAEPHGPSLSMFNGKELAENEYIGVIDGKLNRDLARKNFAKVVEHLGTLPSSVFDSLEEHFDFFQEALDSGKTPPELAATCSTSLAQLYAISMTLAPKNYDLVD